jgi:hypothetical protein
MCTQHTLHSAILQKAFSVLTHSHSATPSLSPWAKSSWSLTGPASGVSRRRPIISSTHEMHSSALCRLNFACACNTRGELITELDDWCAPCALKWARWVGISTCELSNVVKALALGLHLNESRRFRALSPMSHLPFLGAAWLIVPALRSLNMEALLAPFG